MITSASADPTGVTPRVGAGDVAAMLDPSLLALAAERNIGALATLKGDRLPQLSSTTFTLDARTAIARISVIADWDIVANLRRDPRASIFVASPDGWTYAVLEGTVELSPVALAPEDDTVDDLVDVFRHIRGEDPYDMLDYRATMVADRWLVARLRVAVVYGISKPRYAVPAWRDPRGHRPAGPQTLRQVVGPSG